MACSFLLEIISPSRLWSSYISPPFWFVVQIFFLGSLLSSIHCICSLQFILHCANLSLILKMPNCSLMSLLLFLYKRVYPAIGVKNIISAAIIVYIYILLKSSVVPLLKGNNIWKRHAVRMCNKSAVTSTSVYLYMYFLTKHVPGLTSQISRYAT